MSTKDIKIICVSDYLKKFYLLLVMSVVMCYTILIIFILGFHNFNCSNSVFYVFAQ